MRAIVVVLCAAILAKGSANALAQQAPRRLAPTDRVRINYRTLEGALQFDGLFVRATPDSLVARDSLTFTQSWQWSDVVGVERFAGRRGHSGLGALIGAGVGLAVGIPAGIIAKRESQFFEVGTGGAVLIAGVITGAGAGLGALIGLGLRSDRWEAVPLDPLRYSGLPR